MRAVQASQRVGLGHLLWIHLLGSLEENSVGVKNSKVLREMEDFVVDDFSTELLGKSHNFLGFLTYKVVLYRILLACSGLLREVLQRAVCRRWHPQARQWAWMWSARFLVLASVRQCLF